MGRVREVLLTWDPRSGKFQRGKNAADRRFLRGPVPLGWLEAAARLPGSTLAVGVALWQLAGLRGTREGLALSTERLAPFGVSRHSKDRALRALLAAGLVDIERKRGRSPRVSLRCD
jgi:DNA-binding transcriptional ArsR family regulator